MKQNMAFNHKRGGVLFYCFFLLFSAKPKKTQMLSSNLPSFILHILPPFMFFFG